MSLTLRTIVLTACDYYGVSTTEMLAERRSRAITRPRQIIMYLCRKHTGRSLPAIGRTMGGRDHTTVLHGIRNIEDKMQTNPEIAEQIADIEARLRSVAELAPEDASAIAARLEVMPSDATSISADAVLKMANVLSERDGRLKAMQEHLGAALAATERMAAEQEAREQAWAEQRRLWEAQKQTRKFRVVPAHIIDRDLVA